MKLIFTIYLKEFLETIRDRKTLFFMLALPTFVMPLIFYGTFKFMENVTTEERQRVLKIALVGERNWPKIREIYRDNSEFKLIDQVNPSAVARMIRNGELDAALLVPDDFQELLDEGFQASVDIQSTGASSIDMVYGRVSQPLVEYGRELRDQRLKELGVSASLQRESLLEPILAKESRLASTRERLGEHLGAFLPYIFIIFTFLGAMYPAADLGAGEKERTTLETLLISPVERWQLVVGKYLVVASAAVISAGLSIVSTALSALYMVRNLEGREGQDLLNFISSIALVDFLKIGLLILPLACIFAALLLSVSIYAKSYKEAQAYGVPISYLVIFPVLLSILPGVKLTLATSMVPLLNVSLASKEIIKGTLDPLHYMMIFASTLLIAVFGILFCSKWFQREEVLFRT